MKQYAKRFLSDEEGAEMLEWGIVIGLAVAVLIAIIIAIVSVVKNKMLEAGKAIDEAGTGSANADWDAHKEDVNSALDALD